MLTEIVKSRFESLVRSGAGDATALALSAKDGSSVAAADLAALFARAAFVEPTNIAEAYDGAAAGWFGDRASGATLSRGGGEVSPALWSPFWDFIEDERRLDSSAFTVRTARLGAHVDDGFAERAGAASLAFPGVRDAVLQGWPDRFRLEELAACPLGSLGADLHHVIVANGFELEVLDRDALGLAHLRPPLDYLNVRILHCHDLWHLVGGYDVTALHEIAISAFQLAQFGHNYSAQFLTVVTTMTAAKRPEGLRVLLETVLSAWLHGRRTPQLLGVDWKSVWNDPMSAVRARLGVVPYASPFPPDLVEQVDANAGARHDV